MIEAILYVPRIIAGLLAHLFKALFGVSIQEASADLLLGVLGCVFLLTFFGFWNIVMVILAGLIISHIYGKVIA